MISQKAKYAFKALLYLAERTPETTVQIEEIARAEGVPRKFLEQILLELKHSGLIASRRGRAGGYHLVRPASEITIGQVLRIIDGPIAPLPCLSRTAYRRCKDCRDEASCSVRRLFSRTYEAMLVAMDNATLAAVLSGRRGGRRTAVLENVAAG
jgi:Rrf2 family protein